MKDNTDFKVRKSARLKNYDYSAVGAYFITICTHNRQNLLSEITEKIHELPENRLTIYGTYVDDEIMKLEEKFNIELNTYVIMPNHIHLLVVVKQNQLTTHELSHQHNRSTIDKMVGYLKMNVSKKAHLTHIGKIWQRSYHDHIIRDEKDYLKIWEYIDTNVFKWYDDCFYS